jgi:hypothetical protein
MEVNGSESEHARAWKPLDTYNTIQDCTECLRTGHASFGKMSFGDMAKIENTLRGYDDSTRAQAINTLIADFAGDVPMKYAPAMQLRYALENVANPRSGKNEAIKGTLS